MSIVIKTSRIQEDSEVDNIINMTKNYDLLFKMKYFKRQ